MILLIIDKEAEEVRSLRFLVEWRQYEINEVYTAYSEKKGLEIAENHHIDLIIYHMNFNYENENLWIDQIKEKNPFVEMILTGKKLERRSFKQVIRMNAIDYLEMPVEKEDLEQALQLFQKRVTVKRNFEIVAQGGKYWKQNHMFVQELFWKDLCLNRTLGGPEEIEEASEKVEADLNKDMTYQLIMVVMKNQDEMWSTWGQDYCQSSIQSIAREVTKEADDYCKVVVIYSRVIIILDQNEFENAEEKCNHLIERCKAEINADVICYFSEPVFCEKISKAYLDVLSYSKDDILKNHRIIKVQNQYSEQNTEIIVPERWKDILYTANPLKLVDEVRAYLIPLAHNNQLSEKKIRIFQQDMLQLFFSYMDKKEISARELYDNPKIFKLYKIAILSIDGMCQWVLTCTEYITGMSTGINREPNERIVKTIKEYIKDNLKGEITVESIAEYVHLSPGHMSKIFKRQTSSTLKDYIMKKRMEKAKELLRTAELSVSDVGTEIGYDNSSYFIRQFKKYYHVTPKQFQKQ